MEGATPRSHFQNIKHTNHQYMTSVFHLLQRKLGLTAGYSTLTMEALKTNVLIWGMFMSSSMKAAIRLGSNHLANLEDYKNTNFEEIQSLFNITQKNNIKVVQKNLNVKLLESSSPVWTRSVFVSLQAIKWTKAKVRVYSASVLCVGQMNESKEAISRWEGQAEELKMYLFYKEL